MRLNEACSIIENPRFARDVDLEQLPVRAIWNGRSLAAGLSLFGTARPPFGSAYRRTKVPADHFHILCAPAFLLSLATDRASRKQTVIICESSGPLPVTDEVTLSSPYTCEDFCRTVSPATVLKFLNNRPFVADATQLHHLDVVTYSFATVKSGGVEPEITVTVLPLPLLRRPPASEAELCGSDAWMACHR